MYPACCRHSGTWFLLLLLPLAPAAFGRTVPDPAATCGAAKLLAAGLGAKAVLACHGHAAASGRPVSPACVAGADHRVEAGFLKAERRGGCATPADAAGISGRLDRQAAAAALAVRPATGRSKCATGELRAIGIGVVALLRTRAKFVVRSDRGQFESGRAAARIRLQHAFTAAVRKSGCMTKDPTTADTYAESIAGLAGPLRARLEATKLIQIEPSARDEILAKRTELEAQGFGVAADGSLLTGTPSPLGGWLAVLGSAQGRSLADDGIVALDLPAAAPFEGAIHHPSDDEFVTGPLYLPDLAAEGEPLQTISFEMRNQGPCGMNVNPADDPSQCHGAATARASTHGRAALNPDRHQFPPQVTRELGTYPNDAANAVQTACLDYDGFIESTTDRGTTSLVGISAYPGSTCFNRVETGCCDNEQADVVRVIASTLPRSPFPIIPCTKNHHARFCQSLTKGDVSLRVRGHILKRYDNEKFEVTAGESVPITVHNNGCYGTTHISKTDRTRLLPLGGHLSGDDIGGGSLKHYSDVASGYIPDRTITYEAPSPCPSDPAAGFRRDEYSFETDGVFVAVGFECPTTTTTTAPVCTEATLGRSGRSACNPIIDWVGTSRHVFDEVGVGFSHHYEIEASYTLTNDPAQRQGNGDEDLFVVKGGNLTYRENDTDGACTTTVEDTSVALTPFPGGIPVFHMLVKLPDTDPFVVGSSIEGVPVIQRTSCPPRPVEMHETGVSAEFLLFPLMPRFGFDATGQTFHGTFQPAGEHDTFEWSMTRIERVQ